MNKEGGLLLIASSIQQSHGSSKLDDSDADKENMLKQQNGTGSSILDASVLDRLSKIKIIDESEQGKIDDAKSNRARSVSATSFCSSVSSGIGSAEVSPNNSGNLEKSSNINQENTENGKQDNPKLENPKLENPKKVETSESISEIQHRRNSTMTAIIDPKQIETKENRDDQHAKSLTLPDVVSSNEKKSNSTIVRRGQNQKAAHLSPAEFFQMSRLRASALANKLNTAATFGGSKDLVTTISTNGQKENVKTDSTVDELTKSIGDVKLDEKDEKKQNDDGDLIGRSPVPVYSNNRHVQHPYRQQGAKYPGQPIPSSGYPQKAPDGSPMTPADFLQQQRMRASACQPFVSQSPQQYPTAASGPYVMYQQAATPPNSYQQSPDQGMYSPESGYGSTKSPQQFDAALPSPWINSDQNHMVPMGNSSPIQSDENLNSYPMVCSPLEESMAADRLANIGDELREFFQKNPIQHATTNQAAADQNVDELPESLCDFILKYSRRYSNGSSAARSGYGDGGGSGMSSGCVSGEPSPMSTTDRRSSNTSLSGDESGVEDDRLSSISNRSAGRPESVFMDSAMPVAAADGEPPNISTAAQMSGQLTKMDEKSTTKYRPLRPKQPTQVQPQQQVVPQTNGQIQIGGGKARQRLRDMIVQRDFDAAWAWAMRCCQACPGSLLFRDVDGDSLLHIVVWHKDLAKIYAVTEILMKDDQHLVTKPFDLPNKLDETPLFLAVEKRMADVVAYLLECGANPNIRARNHDGDGPLHYAAARGMLEIVQLFCSSTKTNFNLLNGSGMTPLLCAVKNHGVIEEESQCLVNNKPTIRALLKAGADPKIPDVASGKSVLHYCVERMDPDLVELFRDHLSKDAMSQLVNLPDYNGDTPLHILSRMVGGGSVARTCSNVSSLARAEGEEEMRRKMLNTLIDCGADVSQSAGGLGDSCSSFVVLYPDTTEHGSIDDIQFTVLDSPDSY